MFAHCCCNMDARAPRRTPEQQMLLHQLEQLHALVNNNNTTNNNEPSSPQQQPQDQEQQAQILAARKIQDLLNHIDPTERADPVVEDLLLQIADDFITSVATCACQLAKHRGSQTLDVADVQLHLEKYWNIRVPGFSAPDAIKPSTRRNVVERHQKRVQVVKRAVAAAPTPAALAKKRKTSDSSLHTDEFPQQ